MGSDNHFQCWIVLSILLKRKIMRRLKKNIEWMGDGKGETIHCTLLKYVQ